MSLSFDKTHVNQLSQQLAEPTWLNQRRLESLERFGSLTLPSTKVEEWKYTDIAQVPFANQALELPTGNAGAIPQAVQDRLAQSELAGYLVFSGADLIHAQVPQSLIDQGVVFSSLHQAMVSHPQLVQEALFSAVNAQDLLGTQTARPENSTLPALNAALFTHGVFLYIPKNVEFDTPLGVFKYLEGGKLSIGRTLIVGDVNSKAVYIEEYISPAKVQPSIDLSTTEIIVRDGANVRHAHIQVLGDGFYHFHRQRAHLGRDSSLNDLVVNMGGTLSRADVQSQMKGEGSSSEMLGLYFTSGQQHVDHYTMQHHQAPHAFSDVLYKGAAKDQSRTVYAGIIMVAEGAQKTDAYQTNRNLLLSNEARSDSVPQLEIAANDVKCSHGSSTAPVEPGELFYLMSRGLSKHMAQQILVKGHMTDVLTRIPIAPLRAHIEQIIEEKVRV